MDQTEQAPEAPATPAATYAEFSSVFDELMEPTPTPANTDTTSSPAALQQAADASKAEAATPPPAEPASGESATPAAPAAVAEPPAPVVEGGEAGEAAAAGASQAATDWEAKYKELQAQQAAAAQTPTPPPPAPVQQQAAPQQQVEPELYSADEKAMLARFEEDWPDVARASQLRMRGELTAAVRHVFHEIKRVYDPLITQALQSTTALEDHTVVGEIRKGHNDYNEALHAEVSAWVGTLKGMQRKVYEAVVEAGEPDEVIDLISEFKKATGRAVPAIPAAAVKPAVATPAGKVTNISEAAKKAAKAMGVVEGKRTATTAAADPNDFDAAWAEAIAEK
jgi:hypothetical protein